MCFVGPFEPTNDIPCFYKIWIVAGLVQTSGKCRTLALRKKISVACSFFVPSRTSLHRPRRDLASTMRRRRSRRRHERSTATISSISSRAISSNGSNESSRRGDACLPLELWFVSKPNARPRRTRRPRFASWNGNGARAAPCGRSFSRRNVRVTFHRRPGLP